MTDQVVAPPLLQVPELLQLLTPDFTATVLHMVRSKLLALNAHGYLPYDEQLLDDISRYILQLLQQPAVLQDVIVQALANLGDLNVTDSLPAIQPPTGYLNGTDLNVADSQLASLLNATDEQLSNLTFNLQGTI